MFTQVMRWSAGALAALILLFLVVLAALAVPTTIAAVRGLNVIIPQIIGGILLVLFAGVLAIFTRLSITIDMSTLTVGYGPFQERVPLEQITSCGVTTYHWMQWGGFGIRMRRGTKLYNVPGDQGRVVQLVLAGGRQLLFSSPDPEAVCRALHERRPDIAIT